MNKIKPRNLEYGELFQEYMKVVKELEKYKEVEKKLGIDLVKYVRMIEGGFYGRFKNTDDEGKEHEYISYIDKDFTVEHGIIIVDWKNTYVECVFYEISDEGKTWALTREELGNK